MLKSDTGSKPNFARVCTIDLVLSAAAQRTGCLIRDGSTCSEIQAYHRKFAQRILTRADRHSDAVGWSSQKFCT